ncbi:MAG: hypothetical protein JSS45_09740 [Proteobacteria bacterium]|nr:hypothetical protein [Pseudomonadota bacterium]
MQHGIVRALEAGAVMIRQIALGVALAALVPLAGAATPFAPAATLTSSSGTVLVNNGSQFVAAKPGQTIKAGDRVMVMSGGTATVKYANGQSAAIPANSLVSFDSRGFGGYASAATGRSGATPVGSMYGQAVGQGGGSDDDSQCRFIGSDGASHNRCLGWALAGVGVIALLVATQGGHHNHTDHSLSAP